MTNDKVFNDEVPDDEVTVLANAKRLSRELNASLPIEHEAKEGATIGRSPFKVLVVQASYLYRANELAQDGLALLEIKKVVSACIVIRALAETAAMHNYLTKYVVRCASDENINGLDEVVTRLLMGSKTDEKSKIQAVNVLTAIDKVENLRLYYDTMSEYAHPNWLATTCTYSNVDSSGRKVLFSDYRSSENSGTHEFSPILIGVAALSLNMIIENRKKVEAHLPKIDQIYERAKAEWFANKNNRTASSKFPP